jgi:anti-sigma B factor antagonist
MQRVQRSCKWKATTGGPQLGRTADPRTQQPNWGFILNVVPFNAITRDAGNRVRHLVLSGELDMAAIPELRRRLSEGAGEFECLVVEMSGLTFLDSTGIHFLLDLHARAERDGWLLRIVPGPPEVQRVLEIAGVAEVLPWDGAAVANDSSTAHPKPAVA